MCKTFLDDAAWQVREREPSNIHPRNKPSWPIKKSPIDTIVFPILFKLQAIAWTDFICVQRDPPPTFGNCLAHEIIKLRRQRAAIIKKCKGVNIRKHQRRLTFAWDFHLLYQSAVRCLYGVDNMQSLGGQICHSLFAQPFVVSRITSLMQVVRRSLETGQPESNKFSITSACRSRF